MKQLLTILLPIMCIGQSNSFIHATVCGLNIDPGVGGTTIYGFFSSGLIDYQFPCQNGTHVVSNYPKR